MKKPRYCIDIYLDTKGDGTYDGKRGYSSVYDSNKSASVSCAKNTCNRMKFSEYPLIIDVFDLKANKTVERWKKEKEGGHWKKTSTKEWRSWLRND